MRLVALWIISFTLRMSFKVTTDVFLDHPSSVGRRSWTNAIPSNSNFHNHAKGVLTEEILHQISVHRAGEHVPKGNDGSSHLAQAELLGRGGEGVGGVEGLGADLPGNLAVGQLVRVQDAAGPESPGLVEDGLVEDVVVTKEGVGAAGLVAGVC